MQGPRTRLVEAVLNALEGLQRSSREASNWMVGRPGSEAKGIAQCVWTFELNHRATVELELELDSVCSLLLRVKKVEVGTNITYFSHIK